MAELWAEGLWRELSGLDIPICPNTCFQEDAG